MYSISFGFAQGRNKHNGVVRYKEKTEKAKMGSVKTRCRGGETILPCRSMVVLGGVTGRVRTCKNLLEPNRRRTVCGCLLHFSLVL